MVWNIFYFHPYLGKSSNLTSIFFKWVEPTNQLVVLSYPNLATQKLSSSTGRQPTSTSRLKFVLSLRLGDSESQRHPGQSFLRKPQHTPGYSIPKASPFTPKWKEFRNINCWLRVWGMFQGYVGKFLDPFEANHHHPFNYSTPPFCARISKKNGKSSRLHGI